MMVVPGEVKKFTETHTYVSYTSPSKYYNFARLALFVCCSSALPILLPFLFYGFS